MKAVRTGFNTMWRCAGPYMNRKNIKRAGEFRHDNQHGGRLWASPLEKYSKSATTARRSAWTS